MLFGPHYPKGNLPARMEGSAINRMPFDAIQRIRAGEQAAREKRADAAARRERTLADSQARCQRIKQEARGRLDQAARLIMERIGNV